MCVLIFPFVCRPWKTAKWFALSTTPHLLDRCHLWYQCCVGFVYWFDCSNCQEKRVFKSLSTGISQILSRNGIICHLSFFVILLCSFSVSVQSCCDRPQHQYSDWTAWNDLQYSAKTRRIPESSRKQHWQQHRRDRLWHSNTTCMLCFIVRFYLFQFFFVTDITNLDAVKLCLTCLFVGLCLFSAQGLSNTQCGGRKWGATAIWTRQNC